MHFKTWEDLVVYAKIGPAAQHKREIKAAVNLNGELIDGMKACLEYDNKEVIKQTLRDLIAKVYRQGM